MKRFGKRGKVPLKKCATIRAVGVCSGSLNHFLFSHNYFVLFAQEAVKEIIDSERAAFNQISGG